MKNNVKLRVWVFAGWLAFATATHAQQDAPGVTAPLGAGFKVPHLLVKEQSRVVFYRAATDVGAGVASIYINGVYQASLQGGAFTEVCLPPSAVEVGARMVTGHATTTPKPKR